MRVNTEYIVFYVNRNAQIADLQQKVLVADGESRLKQRVDGITSIVEAKYGLKVLMSEVSKMLMHYFIFVPVC